MTNTDTKPWYRQIWPWLVMVPPAAAVVGGFWTAWLAGGPPALVVDDYGEIAMVTQQRYARDQRARELQLSGGLEFMAAASDMGTVRVHVNAGDSRFVLPAAVRLQLVHPTREQADRDALLSGGNGQYSGEIERPPGRVYVQLADLDETWRLVGELQAGSTQLDLRPVGRTGSGP